MQVIGTNSIRVYHVDPYSSHDGCMSAFANAGIYVWLDLDTFNTTVEQSNPQWTEEQFLAFCKVMDVFQQYDNLAGFWIGNEVISSAAGSPAAPYIKAATTDMKSYMAAKSYRQIPIGYSAADIAELRPMLQNYLACGSNPNQIIDFFGLNSYEWCGDATYQSSGYSNLQAMAEGYSIPIFFSETGCNVGGERTFNDQAAIFGPEMVDTWSGSIIYEWVQETNDYGLVAYPNGQVYSGAPTSIQPDYNNLESHWKTINLSGVAEANYSPSNSPPICPLATMGWGVNGDVPLPTLGAGVVQAVAASVKPTIAPRPTTSSSIVPTTTPGPAGTITTSYTAMSLGLQYYPSVSGNLSPTKKSKTTSTLTNTADLGIVANSPTPSITFLSASVSVVSPSIPSVSGPLSSHSPKPQSTPSNPSPVSQPSTTSNAIGQNDTTSSSTTTPSAPNPTKSHSAATSTHPFVKLWDFFNRLGGYGGEAGFIIAITLFSVALVSFL
jgi:hypothetical protein